MIGKNIAVIRKRRGYTLTEVAEKAGVSKSYLSNIERNTNKNPSILFLRKIANVLNIDLRVLLSSEYDFTVNQSHEQEWIEFINELQKNGVQKEQVKEYRKLIEFINWQNKISNI